MYIQMCSIIYFKGPPYLSIDNDPEPVVVGDEKRFVIKQNFIANPKPTIVWEKVDNSEGSIIRNRSEHVTILNYVNGRVNYTTILERKNVTISDVGFYKLYLENDLGNYSSITDVIFKREYIYIFFYEHHLLCFAFLALFPTTRFYDINNCLHNRSVGTEVINFD